MIYIFALASFIGVFIDCFSIKNKPKKLYIIFLIFLFSYIAGIRLSTVPDTEAYIEYIILIREDIDKFGLFNYTGIFEFGFEVLVRLFVFLGFNYRTIFFVIALIISSLGANIFIDKRLPISEWLLFISFYGIYFSFIILRAGLSIVFFCYFVKYVKCKKIKSIISLIISFLFHKSMLFAVVIYFLSKLFKQKSFQSEIITIAFFFLIYVSSIGNAAIMALLNYLDKFINFSLWNRFIYYLYDFKVEAFNISIRLLFNIFVYCLARYLKRNNTNKNTITDKLIYAGIMINLFVGSNTLVGRIVDFLLIFNISNYIIILKSIKNRFVLSNTDFSNSTLKSNVIVKGNAYALDGVFLKMIILLSFILINLFFIIRIIL